MKKILLLFCLVWSIFILAIPTLAAEKKSLLQVWHLPLNSGEVYLVQTADGKNILYDTGGREEDGKLISCLQQQGIKKLDLLILSHPHNSSIGGVQLLLTNYAVEQIMDSGIYYHGEWLHAYQRLAGSKGIITSSAEPSLNIPLISGVNLECQLNRSGLTVDEQALNIRLLLAQLNVLLTPQGMKLMSASGEIQVAKGCLVKSDGTGYNLSHYALKAVTGISSQGDFILIEQKKHLLSLYREGKVLKQYPVAVGKRTTPTPLGNYKVVNKIKKPWKPAFGVRWLGFHPTGWPAYGIHGTNEPWSIGKSVSHGCVRMRNSDVLDLYYAVEVGTPIKIVP